MVVDMSCVKVLIVDDNGYMLIIFWMILYGFGIKQILEFKDLVDVFDMVCLDSVDIIIIDYQMEILDGLDFVCFVWMVDDSLNLLILIIMFSVYLEKFCVELVCDVGVIEFCCKLIIVKEMFVKIVVVINEFCFFICNKMYFGLD